MSESQSQAHAQSPSASQEASSSSSQLSPRDKIAAAVQARLYGASATEQGPSGVGAVELSRRKREEEELLLKLRRVVDLQIRRDNNYANAAECLRTLETLLDNILAHPTDSKYRSFKAQNARIQRTVLSRNGGQAYLLLAGFGTRTVDFKQEWFLSTSVQPSSSPTELPDFRWRKVELAHRVLKERVAESEERAAREVERKQREEEVEKNRAKRALDEAREDRDRVAMRAERDRIARAAVEEQERAKEAATAASQQGNEEHSSTPVGSFPEAPSGITRDDYTREVPFDEASHRPDAQEQEANADAQGEAPPPYGREHLGSGRRLGSS